MPPFKPSAFARRVLRKLASGAVGRAREDGDYQIGATTLPARLTDEFARHDLVELAPCGGLTLSVAGRAFVRRNLQKSGLHGARGHRQAGKCGDGEAYRLQHQVVHRVQRVIDGKKRMVQINSAESPLGWLAQRKDRRGKPFLAPAQVAAGERLRCDFTVAGMTPRMTPGYDGVPVNAGPGRIFPGLNATEAQVSAKKRFAAAMTGVGPDLCEILLRVCCFLEGIGEAEQRLDWPARSGKVVLRIALDRLAGHYGMQ